MNQHMFDGFYDEMMKLSGVAGATTKILKGVMTRDPKAAWRTASHASRRAGRLAKADIARVGRGAKETGNIEKLLASGKINKRQAAEMMKVKRPSPTPRLQGPTAPAEGTQVARSVKGPVPKPTPSYSPRAERTTVSAPPSAAKSPYAAAPQRGGVMERAGKWYGDLTPGKRTGLRIGATALGAGGLGYGAG